ncbi:MAG: hypothetical protein HY079_01955, partial [Elusimicrobia bacterium]|nr:hypothetical protein [Elusimicrobiota bacterium]
YAPGKDYAAADLPALTAALRAAHHLADVNVASQEGYRRAPALDAGAERALTKDAPAAGEPAVLRFVVDPRGRWQLVRLGFTLDPKAAPGPRGPFVAVNLYDRAGLYAPEFPDAAALAASGARTFYGATPPAPRARRPLCPAAPAPAGRVVE